MQVILGIIFMALGAATGIYIGIWVMFIGGIIDVIEFIKGGLDSYNTLGWGILKILLASPAGYLSALIFIIPGKVIIEDA